MKEAIEIYNDTDIDSIPNDENEFTLKELDLTKWIKLFVWYNWDNIYDEKLFFFKRNVKEGELFAFSASLTDPYEVSPTTVFSIKKFYLGDLDSSTLSYRDDAFDDPWEIEEGDLDISGTEVFKKILKSLFNSNIVIYDDAISILGKI